MLGRHHIVGLAIVALTKLNTDEGDRNFSFEKFQKQTVLSESTHVRAFKLRHEK